MAEAGDDDRSLTIESVRKFLIREEDSIVFSLIERAKYPLNANLYDKGSCCENLDFSDSLFEFIVQETEAVQAKVGRYESPEEHPFFPDNLPSPVLPPYQFPSVLYPAAASININKDIWDMYINKFLPLLVAEGDDGNYACTAASDLQCLQALSRRVHYGKFVAEVKFKDAPDDYSSAIRSQDRDALMKMLTFESVEEMVKRRVEKKAMVFGQDVNLSDSSNENEEEKKYKVDPSLVSRLYGEWLMPLTKLVEVEYLLHRLD